MQRTIRIHSILLAGVLVTPVAAQTFDRGQALYENHCAACHEPAVHTRAERRAASRDDVRRWVETWSFHAGLDWSVEEIEDVTDYLDRQFYRFTGQP